MSAIHLRAAALAAAALVPAVALAQPRAPQPQPPPSPQAPVGLGTYDPNPSTAAPAPQPRAPVVVTFGADGMPVVNNAQPEGPQRFFRYDAVVDTFEEDVPVYGGPTPELHVVGRGDTLWAICWFYFNDPWQWPKVWSYNPQITNPHWIYPGDLVRLLPRGLIGAITDLAAVDTDPTGDDPNAGQRTAAPTPQRDVTVNLRQTAFIDRKHLDSAWRIVGSVEERELLTEGDEVFLSYPQDDIPQVGRRYSVYAEDKGVDHPKTGKPVGSYVRLLGEVEIVNVKQDKRARARITTVTGEIERGARVGPLLTQFKNVPPVRNTVDATGTIVAMLGNDYMIGSGEVVFVDLGKGQGLQAGNRMYVVRRGDAFSAASNQAKLVGQNDGAFPDRTLGEIVLVQVDDFMSVGLVTLSIEEMGVGDRVIMRKQ